MNDHAPIPPTPAAARRWLRAAAFALTAWLAVCCAAVASPERWGALATPLFEHLGLDQGLPHAIGMTLAQDGDGYLWIGTQSGLARWDGYRVRSFRHDAAQPSSLPGDFIQILHTDIAGRLWVGTAAAGLAMYDKRSESFIRPVEELSRGPISAIASDGQGNLWIGTPDGLKYYDTARRTLRRYSQEDTPGLPDNQIRALLLDRAGNLWIGSATGLSRMTPGGAIAAVPVSGESAGVWRDSVLSLGENQRGQIAFGTLKSGIGIVDAGAGAGRLLPLRGVKDAQANMVLAVVETVPGIWWASTYGGGVIEYRADADRATRILHQPAVSFSLSHDRAAALLRDRSGMIWVTTERGVDVYDPHSEAIDAVFGAEGALEAGVSALLSDSRGEVWIGLADQGIDIVAANGARRAALRPDPHQPDTALPNRMVLSLAEAEPGEAWIGTQLGLYRTSRNGAAVRRVPLPQANALPRVGTILTRKGELWLGTFEGLLRYNPVTGELRRYVQGPQEGGGLTDNRIHAVLADADGALWVATRNGLNRLDPDSGKVEQIKANAAKPDALSEAVISSLVIDRRGRLWVGTYGGGICIMTGRDALGEPVFERLGTGTGLTTGTIMGLQSDPSGRVWAATSDSIAVIDSATLRARALTRADGLPFRTFFIGASAVTAERDLLFGATAGLAVVYPGRLNDWAYRPPLVISAVRRDQQPLTPAELARKDGPVLVLQPDNQSFEVELAALDYSAPQRNRYSYLLEGFDQRWTEVDASRRIISYNHLPPGAYVLRMRGSNRDGLWNADELSMPVLVMPAWHQTWWAWLGYCVAVCALAWALVRWRVRRLQRKQEALQALVYSRTQHLEKLNAIVKSINEQMDFDALLHTILHEATIIKGVDSALALVREHGTDALSLRAAWGRIDASADAYSIDLRQAELRYAPADSMIAPDIFEVHHPHSLPGDVCALLSVRVVIDGQVEGYLIFENYQYQATFAPSDIDLLKALKEPFTSAYLKARAMRMIDKARANAEAATRAKSEFLANISHEIRTPMNAILGFAGLGTHLDLPPQPLDYFRKISRAGQSLLQIINDVLDFSKIESGKLELEALPFDLPDTLNQIADLFAWRAAERGLELVIGAAPDVPNNLLGDPLRLGQILVNLVGNALKFTASGHIELRVEVDASSPTVMAGAPLVLRFTVEDTGLGISQEQQARLFQAFAQADASTTRLYGGTGLGLAISQQLVRKMGGEIKVDSEPGVGSSFSFTVHLQAAADQTPRVQPVPPAAQGKRVLVVDDSESTRHMLKLQLGMLGLKARAVGSGTAAVAALQLDPYDVLLIDADMPDLDGIDMLRRIAEDAELAAVPAILMTTAYAREHDKDVIEHTRHMPFLDKPASPQQLRGVVLAALGLEASPPASAIGAPPSVAIQRIRAAQVLVVDDNAINQQVAAEILQRAGVRVDLAGSGEEAARMTDAGAYDAVLMDIQMPDMDGYQATALIRRNERHAALPIIAMTAHAVAGYRERCLERGMNDYVTKPIDPDTLYAVLATWVQPDLGRAEAADSERPLRPAAPVTPRAGIDMEAAMERLGGHGALLVQLLGLFAHDFESSLRQIHDAVHAGELARAADLVHRVRGAAGNLSATGLFASAGALEERLRAEPQSLAELLRAFVDDFNLVMNSARTAVEATEDEAAPAS
ncbi:signal transduction histidine kinase/ligand-binding sensor domain-containing protein/DNA-binding response OmpR family regulator/HPt (histidine-containing phosphotransfer) domain-containing protein [Duganella sp. 1224]|uniref:response regulator n=1 Tax=Duganella sp. 1224 TaxID=2587052 RepID=UPI0015C7478D|nr:response regulator [Duganella sp. 1224]NYE60187.1 signal transduction histidine kinase/ligand-binding sensor domain-containing protein/DNA-binding response OmpR family regulator/HPt (histidine-containing phosphotransfer) domain-containing protein [Duganella sp. 1224]